MADWTAAEHEPKLARPARRAGGVFYTPAELVRFIVDRSRREHDWALVGDDARPPRIVDPACGAGAFLCEAAAALLAVRNESETSDGCCMSQRLSVVQRSIFGLDIDSAAAQQARLALARLIAEPSVDETQIAELADALANNIVQADALLGDRPAGFANDSFDLVVGNPPYVNIRQLVKVHGGDYVERLRERFTTARGHFDLYIPFVELAWRLLRPGGQAFLVLPNKIAGLGYAAECRRMLLERTRLQLIADLSSCRVFVAAGVYPWVLGWSKSLPNPAHSAEWLTADSAEELNRGGRARFVEQSTLQADGFRLAQSKPARSTGATVRLGDMATIECGTAGYAASRIAASLCEANELPIAQTGEAATADFIVSGNIDRYAIRCGDVRFMGRKFLRPQLSLDSPALTARQRRLFAQPKVVLSGMTRRLEAAYDAHGLALGVQVYAMLPRQQDLFYLLGLLNSRWLSFWFREQFAAKGLSGGFLAINKAQLTQLPIRRVPAGQGSDAVRRKEIAEVAEALTKLPATETTIFDQLDRRIDSLVYELYRVSDAHIAEVEQAFDLLPGVARRPAA